MKPKATVYAMMACGNSDNYTDLALESFLKTTRLTKDDKFYLFDNDAVRTNTDPNVNHIVNTVPQSFAKNINDAIDIADGRDVFVLSNDVVFTPNWNERFDQYNNAILLPSCNQTHTYSTDLLNLISYVRIEDYNNQFAELCKIAQFHKTKATYKFFDALLMPFYVFRLPAAVYKKVGKFDESFGVGGGEDVDYRLRALFNGISVKYTDHSYLLHFGGKSTWDGTETVTDTEARDSMYESLFAEKWGVDLANLCLSRGNSMSVITAYNLRQYVEDRKFSDLIREVYKLSQ
jgi:GT2 family glycosyltransferase